MQQRLRTRKGRRSDRLSQEANALRLRIYQAKAAFLAIGTGTYMPFLDDQAEREGKVLTEAEKLELRQVMNGRVDAGKPRDVKRVEFIERAVQTQQAA